MVNWLELIEEKENQILAEGEKAYKEAIITLICVISLKLMRTAMFIHGTM